MPLEAFADQVDHRRAPGVARQAHVGLGLDADREGAETHLLAFEFVTPFGTARRALRDQVVGEIVAVVVGLEADQVVIGEAAQNRPVVRQRLQDVGRRAGRVKEKADRVAVAARPELASKQHQMIVVHPDDIVVLEQRAQAIGEHAIDAHVAAGVGAGIFLQVDAVVKDRPQHAVGEAVVIFLDVVLRQIDQDVV